MVRIGRSQLLQLGDQVLGAAEPEIEFDAPLQREQAPVRQLPRGATGERRLADVAEGITAPEAERAATTLDRLSGGRVILGVGIGVAVPG